MKSSLEENVYHYDHSVFSFPIGTATLYVTFE